MAYDLTDEDRLMLENALAQSGQASDSDTAQRLIDMQGGQPQVPPGSPASPPGPAPPPPGGDVPATSPQGMGFLRALLNPGTIPGPGEAPPPMAFPQGGGAPLPPNFAPENRPGMAALMQRQVSPSARTATPGGSPPDMGSVVSRQGQGGPEAPAPGGGTPDLSRFDAQTPEGMEPREDPQVRADMGVARANQIQGVEKQAAVTGNISEQQAGVMSDARKQFMASAEEDRKRQEKFQGELDQHYAQIAQREKELQETKVDPEHFWHEKSTGQRILMAIGMGLAGFGAAATHSPNTVAEMVSRQIDNDIEAQKIEIEKKKGGIERSRSLYADKIRIFGDSQRASAAARQEAYAMAMNKVDELAKSGGGAMQAAQAQQIKGALQDRFAREDLALRPPVTEDVALNREEKRAQIAHLNASAEGALMSGQAKLDKNAQAGQAQAIGQAQGQQAADRVKSTSIFDAPTAWLGRLLPGQNEGKQRDLDRQAYNSQLLTLKAEQLRARGIQRPTQLELKQGLEPYEIQPGDTEERIRAKLDLARRSGFLPQQGPSQSIPGFRPVGGGRESPPDGGPPGGRTPLSMGDLHSAIQRATGGDAATPILVAQAAHETAGGRSMYGYNFGGIKGTAPSGGSANLGTEEVEGSQRRKVQQQFRAYRSPEEGASDFVNLIRTRYPKAYERAQAGDVAGYARALKEGGYYTAPESEYLTGLLRAMGST